MGICGSNPNKIHTRKKKHADPGIYNSDSSGISTPEDGQVVGLSIAPDLVKANKNQLKRNLSSVGHSDLNKSQLGVKSNDVKAALDELALEIEQNDANISPDGKPRKSISRGPIRMESIGGLN